MTVSAIASEIYQAAKKVAGAAWNWSLEWSKAMKKAWKKINGEKIMKYVSKVIRNENGEEASCYVTLTGNEFEYIKKRLIDLGYRVFVSDQICSFGKYGSGRQVIISTSTISMRFLWKQNNHIPNSIMSDLENMAFC